MAQNIIYSLWRGTKDAWLCLLTKLLLFDLLYCFPLFLHFFFTSLIGFILWLKFSTDERYVEDIRGKERPSPVSKGGPARLQKKTQILVSGFICNCRMSTLADWSMDWLICSCIQEGKHQVFARSESIATEVWSVNQHLGVCSVQFSPQSCPALCDSMDCSKPVFPVHHQLPELTQTHVHRVGDVIQPSHPLLSPSPPAFNLSQHQGLFEWVGSLQQVAKILEFQLQHQSFQWIFRIDSL